MSSPETAAEPAPETPPVREGALDRIKAVQLRSQFARRSSLIPAASIAGRSLVMVIAIMTFLASITAGTVWLIAGASQEWTSAIAREATIQVKPRTGRNIEADLNEAAAIARRSPAVSDVRIMPEDASRDLLTPWLGEAMKAADLPVPRLIELTLAGGGSLEPLRDELQRTIPTAALDDHRPWLDRLSRMAAALVIIGLVILALVLAATALRLLSQRAVR